MVELGAFKHTTIPLAAQHAGCHGCQHCNLEHFTLYLGAQAVMRPYPYFTAANSALILIDHQVAPCS